MRVREVEQHVVLVVRAVLGVRAVLEQVVAEVMADDARALRARARRLIENSGNASPMTNGTWPWSSR